MSRPDEVGRRWSLETDPQRYRRVIEGNRWRVYEWRHSGPPLAAPVSATITRAVGDILATLHALRFPVDGVCPWNSTRLAAMSWERLAEVAAARGASWSPALAAAVPTLVDLESIGDGSATAEPVLCHNNLNPGGEVNAAGARALVDGYRARAGSLPPLRLDTFRGAAIGLLNYVAGQVREALHAGGAEEQRYADRGVRHLLTHLPSRATYERVLAAALT